MYDKIPIMSGFSNLVVMEMISKFRSYIKEVENFEHNIYIFDIDMM